MSKPKIFITRKIPAAIIAPYEEQFSLTMWEDDQKPVPKDVLYKEAKQADGVICLITEKIDRAFLEHASHLKIIANMAVGYDNIDVQAAQEQHIIITNTPDVLTETTADLTFALLMATARRLVEASNMIYQDAWGEWSPFMLAGTDIHHKTIGIVGMGRIGEAVARRAQGFNMNVLYHNRTRKEKVEAELGVQYRDFTALLQEADYVVSLIPFVKETENMFDKAAFEQMKSSAIFINASRGGVVDEEALYEALKQKVITAAGLDVFKNEPISASNPLATLNNAVILPHIGSATRATREHMLTLCLDNVSNVFGGGQAITPVK
jgi:glyoxylate reductase